MQLLLFFLTRRLKTWCIGVHLSGRLLFGTPNYVAPEILENRQYGCAVDMWSVGVLTFVLLGVKSELNASKAYKIQINFVGGYPPFHDDNEAKLFERIKCAQFNFDPQ